MRPVYFAAAAVALVIAAAAAVAASESTPDTSADKSEPAVKSKFFKPVERVTQGSVAVEGSTINYQAVAGTLVVHPRDWDDVTQSADSDDKNAKDAKEAPAEASMYFTYYAKRGVDAKDRPITFLYNGGPGSSTVWLHMGAFGPKRVVTADDTHTPAAPYNLINNDYSLLDASDLVFIDAPGTGFSRIAGKDKEKAFYGVDEDAYAFSQFISEFLAKYGRWNSPKYLFGESYGTPRSAVLINMLETERDIDFNGVMLLSQILNFDMSADGPEENPGVDLPYQLALPTYAASAWYHHKLPGSWKDLQSLLTQVEHFAMTDYALALAQGSSLPAAQRDAIAAKLHQFTGLPDWYIKKADLRINGGEFEKTLQDSNDLTTGRLDTRFSGPTMDPLSKQSDYDPQSASISSAYVSAFNDYVRKTLNYGQNDEYHPEIDVFKWWSFKHKPPGVNFALQQSTNTMPDLASAMKYNPNLKVLLNGGYYDLATPYFEGIYEMHHLQIPAKMQANIEYQYYQSGHMVYAHEDSLKQLHDRAAAFVHETQNTSR
ncbi:MAG: peptidase S10 [Rhizomicrobium sp.]|jgi:carboxypeptidase C (cathepsin A)